MIPDAAGQQDRVSGARALCPDLDTVRHHAQSGGRDEHTVALASFNHLGVAGHDRHTGRCRGLGHRDDDAFEVGEREALLEDESRGEKKRSGAAHRDVVQRSVDRERSDIAAGKEQRRDHMAIGRHHQPARHDVETRRIVGLVEDRIAQVTVEYIPDQLGRGAPAAAMGHVHPVATSSVRNAGDAHAMAASFAFPGDRNRP